MKVEASRLVNGVINYADNEVISNLPIAGKWIVGTGIGIATAKANEVVDFLSNNAIAKAIGIVDEDGMFDVDLIADNMRQTASKYGKMTLQIPMVGRLTFSESDIDALRNYIERG